MQRYYITTPIYYVNGNPHIGHAYTTIAADTASRWRRETLGADNVRFVTGTDEHGQKVMEAAAARNMTPKAHCDDMQGKWTGMMERLSIRYDRFFRTTDTDHREVVQGVLQHLFEVGDIYKSEYQGWYLVKDEIFVTEKDREERLSSGENKPEHFQQIKESNYFFKMSSYEAELVEAITTDRLLISPVSRKNEVLGFLKKGLSDLCISRPITRMSWGIPLPFDEDFVTYVWFDALLNYLTATGFDIKNPTADNPWWPADVHLVGKDILTTHSVYWTTMLLAMNKHGLNTPLPKSIFAHGWWVDPDGQKMSKSLGNTIEVDALVDGYGVDATRFFFLREIRFGADGHFSYDLFQSRYNSDLANDLGNLAHRGLSMTTKWLGAKVPALGEITEAEVELRQVATDAVVGFEEHMNKLAFDKALESLWELVKAGNKYIDTQEPWALNRTGQMERLATVKRHVLEICAVAGILLQPFFVTKSAELCTKLALTDLTGQVKALLGASNKLDNLTEGDSVVVGDPLFPRFREFPEAITALFAKKEEETPQLPEMDWIEFGDFEKVILKTGKVISASNHPKADRLLVVEVDCGEARPRTICAGVKSVFKPEDLVGRTVVVVANLKPRKMRGVMSEGMLLAAGGKQVIDLVSVNAPAGEPVR